MCIYIGVFSKISFSKSSPCPCHCDTPNIWDPHRRDIYPTYINTSLDQWPAKKEHKINYSVNVCGMKNGVHGVNRSKQVFEL